MYIHSFSCHVAVSRSLILYYLRFTVKGTRGSVTTNESYGTCFTGCDEIRYHWHMSKSRHKTLSRSRREHAVQEGSVHAVHGAVSKEAGTSM